MFIPFQYKYIYVHVCIYIFLLLIHILTSPYESGFPNFSSIEAPGLKKNALLKSFIGYPRDTKEFSFTKESEADHPNARYILKLWDPAAVDRESYG